MDDDDYRRGAPHQPQGVRRGHGHPGRRRAAHAGLPARRGQLRRRRPSARWSRDVVREIVADAAGTDGMVGGQVVDIESEGKAISAEMLDYIHLHKTAALIRASLRVGALLVGATPGAGRGAQPRRRSRSGWPSRSSTTSSTSRAAWPSSARPPASDERKQKATYPALHGLPTPRAARRESSSTTPSAVLEPLGPRADPIRALGRLRRSSERPEMSAIRRLTRARSSTRAAIPPSRSRSGSSPAPVGRAAVPSGASTGKREAVELRDGDGQRYRGKGVQRAVRNVRRRSRPRSRAWRRASRRPIDRALLELDGTPNKSGLGANAHPRRLPGGGARGGRRRGPAALPYLGGPGARHPAGAAHERAQRRRPRRQRPRHPGVHAGAGGRRESSAKRCAWASRSSTRSRSS